MADMTDPTGYAPGGPLDTAPVGGYTPSNRRREAYTVALDGAELGNYDKRIIDWLCGLDDTTNRTIVSLIWRARKAGALADHYALHTGQCGDHHASGVTNCTRATGHSGDHHNGSGLTWNGEL
jgi:hypothetical protein